MVHTLLIYQRSDGSSPFESWLKSLKDEQGRAIIRARLERVELGNLGNSRSLGGGVFELKIHYGPGYRLYFGCDGPKIVVLLCGGDKSSQKRDITKAKVLWEEYKKCQ